MRHSSPKQIDIVPFQDREQGKAGYELALELSMDWMTNLEHIHCVRNVKDFKDNGVPDAIAWCWVHRIESFLQQY